MSNELYEVKPFRSKLDEERARKIVALVDDGVPYSEIANRFGISENHICRLLVKARRHLEGI